MQNAELWLLIYSHNELQTKSTIHFTLYIVKQFTKFYFQFTQVLLAFHF